eukprot:SAG11_NODE_6612_length_1279_cov_1.161864_1_plen_109_part_00
MGKSQGVPCHKLFGRIKRRWVPVSSWFVAAEPAAMAAAVVEYASQGHMWMKYHISPFHNVVRRHGCNIQAPPIRSAMQADFKCCTLVMALPNTSPFRCYVPLCSDSAG